MKCFKNIFYIKNITENRKQEIFYRGRMTAGDIGLAFFGRFPDIEL